MKLSVIIPVYNEESTISEVVEKVRQVPVNKEIIVVDDGSTDRTGERVRTLSEEAIILRTHKKNLGKGEAIRTALEHVTGDIVIIQDADLELDPKEYLSLLEPIESGKTDVVYGSRFLSGTNRIPFPSRLANLILSGWVRLLFGVRLSDEATAYKVFRTKVLKSFHLQSRRFEFCAEVTAKALRRGYRIYEIPIGYHPRTKSEGKKVRYIRDGMRAIFTLLKYRLF